MKKINKFSSILMAVGCSFLVTNLSAQNVGIGEAAPAQKLHIDGSAAGLQTIRIEDCAVTSGGTNAGELATTNATTEKAAYFDANGDLRVRYVYGDNMQEVAGLSGSQSFTSTSLVNLTGLTITFTPRHSKVYLSFAVTGYVAAASLPQSGWFSVGINKAGTGVIGNFLAMAAELDDVNGSASAATITVANYPITVTPGVSTTITLQGRTLRPDASALPNFTIDKTNYTSYMTIMD